MHGIAQPIVIRKPIPALLKLESETNNIVLLQWIMESLVCLHLINWKSFRVPMKLFWRTALHMDVAGDVN